MRGSLTKRPRRSGTRGYHPLDLDPAAQIRFAGVLIVVVCYRSDGWTVSRAGRRRLVAGRRVPAAALGQTSLGFVENDAPGVKSTHMWVRGDLRAMADSPEHSGPRFWARTELATVGGGFAGLCSTADVIPST